MGPLLVLLVAMTAGAGAYQCHYGTCVQEHSTSPDNNDFCVLNGTCTALGDCENLECVSDYSDWTLPTIKFLATDDLFQRYFPYIDRVIEELETSGRSEIVDDILAQLTRFFADWNDDTALPDSPEPPLIDGPVSPLIDANDTSAD